MLTATIRTDDGKAIGIVVLKEKHFRTGSIGFFGTAKVEIEGRRHQVQVQAVEIGSKAKSDAGATEVEE